MFKTQIHTRLLNGCLELLEYLRDGGEGKEEDKHKYIYKWKYYRKLLKRNDNLKVKRVI